MNALVSLSLCFALIASSGCGIISIPEGEEPTTLPPSYDWNVTATPDDYDYNATFDYYHENISIPVEEGSTTLPPSYDSDVTATPDDYDYNATFDYYYVTERNNMHEEVRTEKEVPAIQSVVIHQMNDAQSGGRSIADAGPITTTLLLSLPALFFGASHA